VPQLTVFSASLLVPPPPHAPPPLSLHDALPIFERLGDAHVELPPLALEDRAVRGLLRQRVPECVLALGLARLLADDLEPLQVERSEEHTSELQSLTNLVCRLLLEKKKNHTMHTHKPGGGISRGTRATMSPHTRTA